MAMSDDGVDIVFDSSITDNTGASSVTGSFFTVADMVYDLGQMPSGFLETGSFVHCACLAHSIDATTDGFVYFADDGRCWTYYQAPTNPIAGGVTLRVGKRQVLI